MNDWKKEDGKSQGRDSGDKRQPNGAPPTLPAQREAAEAERERLGRPPPLPRSLPLGTVPPRAPAPDEAEQQTAPPTASSPPPENEPRESEPPAEPRSSVTPARISKQCPGEILVRFYGKTDVGLVRDHNEDNFMAVDLEQGRRGMDETSGRALAEGLGVTLGVCDGMGGAAAGEVASRLAIDTVTEVLQAWKPTEDRDIFARRLVRAMEEAGYRIHRAAKADRTRRGMGTTATIVAMMDKVMFVGQVGDSRAYLYRNGKLNLITKDQSLVNQLVEAGELTEEEAEGFEHTNIILQALGTAATVQVDLTFLELCKGDQLLLCSDGLSGVVHQDVIAETMAEADSLKQCCERLIELANAGGGPDNITVVVATFDGEGLKAPDEKIPALYQQYPLPADDDAGRTELPESVISARRHALSGDYILEILGGSKEVPVERTQGETRWGWIAAALGIAAIGIAAVMWMWPRAPASLPPEPELEITPSFPVQVASDAQGELVVDGELVSNLGDERPVSLFLTAGDHQYILRRGTETVAAGMFTVAEDGDNLVKIGATPPVLDASVAEQPPGDASTIDAAPGAATKVAADTGAAPTEGVEEPRKRSLAGDAQRERSNAPPQRTTPPAKRNAPASQDEVGGAHSSETTTSPREASQRVPESQK